MRAKKQVKLFPVGLLVASLFFFFNPAISIIDILPDTFGYILLLLGMRMLRDLNDDLWDAYSGFFKMIGVDVAKGLALFFIFGILPPSERSVGTLVATLCFAVIELFLLIPALSHLFAGLLTLANRHGSASLFWVGKERRMPTPPRPTGDREKDERRAAAYEARCARIRHKNETRPCLLDRAKVGTFIFVWVKTALALLPEFSSLSGTEFNNGLVNWYNYITLFRTFAIFVGLIVGIVWLCRMARFIRAVAGDADFEAALEKQYHEEVAVHKEIFLQRAIGFSMILLCIGAVLSADFYIEYYNIIPDVLSAAFLMAGVLSAKKYITGAKTSVVCIGVYGVCSLVSSALTIYFNQVYYFNAIYKDDRAYFFYLLMVAATVVENGMFLASLWRIACNFRQVIRDYTGFAMEGDISETTANHLSGIHKALRKNVTQFFVAGVISAAASVAYELTKASVGFVWMIDFALAVVFFCLFIHATSEIREQMEYKYMLS